MYGTFWKAAFARREENKYKTMKLFLRQWLLLLPSQFPSFWNNTSRISVRMCCKASPGRLLAACLWLECTCIQHLAFMYHPRQVSSELLIIVLEVYSPFYKKKVKIPVYRNLQGCKFIVWFPKLSQSQQNDLIISFSPLAQLGGIEEMGNHC